jgi:hypothetical protein
MICGRLDFDGSCIAGGDLAFAMCDGDGGNLGLGGYVLVVRGSTERVVRLLEGANMLLDAGGRLPHHHPPSFNLPL